MYLCERLSLIKVVMFIFLKLIYDRTLIERHRGYVSRYMDECKNIQFLPTWVLLVWHVYGGVVSLTCVWRCC